ncbi:MAG: hypothetical protein J6P84_03620, partial [Alphaproteobacteria bacterium]|nr:hypothetical protein [Clostridia bacterium]MBO6056043.1 hypothetical protein [Alphaproteobacteria bacterium]
MSAIFKIDSDGCMSLKSTNDYMYLVTYTIEGETTTPAICTAREIFDKMDLDDCYSIDIKNLYLIKNNGTPLKVQFSGTWHDHTDPLKMCITSMNGKRIFDYGYGTDH